MPPTKPDSPSGSTPVQSPVNQTGMGGTASTPTKQDNAIPPKVVTPPKMAEATATSTKRCIMDVQTNTSPEPDEQKKKKKRSNTVAIESIDFMTDDGIIEALKQVKGETAVADSSRLVNIEAILKTFTAPVLKTFFGSLSTDTCPSRKDPLVKDLVKLLSNKRHAFESPTHSSDAPTDR